LAGLYEQKKDYAEALASHKNYVSFKDSVLNVETNAKIAELEIKYETEKKDLSIAENELKVRRRTNQLMGAGGVILILLLSALVIYRIQRFRHRGIRTEMDLKSRINQAEMEKTIAGEKLRISRELHDNRGSQLTLIISSLDNLAYAQKGGKNFEKLKYLSAFGSTALQELRSTIWAMRHDGAELSQLVLKLNELMRQVNMGLESLNMNVLNKVSKPILLSSTQILNLYRIVQESVQNAVKHTSASEILVTFSQTTGGFSLVIADNGQGFDQEKVYGGDGLLNIRQRCEEAEGDFQLLSSEIGTSITCTIGFK